MKIEALKDIQALINAGIEESIKLEYKRELGKSNDEIAKDVSAFANTEGGIIIYGVNEKDKRPIGLSWISDQGVDERIHNIIDSIVEPKLSGVRVTRLNNPDNNMEAVFIINVLKSPDAPHMIKGRYYIRSGSKNRFMDNIEVRNAMVGSGRLSALKTEVETNDKIMNNVFDIMRVPWHYDYEKPIIAVPFHTDVWKSIVASGYVSVLNKDFAEALFDTYGLLDDINSLLKIAMEDNTRFEFRKEMKFALSINRLSSTKESSLGDAIRDYLEELNKSMKRLKEFLKKS